MPSEQIAKCVVNCENSGVWYISRTFSSCITGNLYSMSNSDFPFLLAPADAIPLTAFMSSTFWESTYKWDYAAFVSICQDF